jgi:DNA-binding transcriptional ArsR family regulator
VGGLSKPFQLALTCNHLVAYSKKRPLDKVFKALADKSRRKLLDQLFVRGGQTLGELADKMATTRQAVSKHLAVLEAAKLIATQWRGREKLHYLNPVPIHQIAERWIAKFERHRLSALAELKSSLEEKHNERQPKT